MNYAVNKPVIDFINDFNLLDGDSVMHFDARILYVPKSIPHEYECPVAIVTIQSKKLDAIYLLNSQIKEEGFEEMFIIKNEKIKYEKGKYLLIERDGDLRVYIFHRKSLSSPKKILEGKD